MLSLLKKKWKEYTIELFLVMLGIIIPFLIYQLNDKIHQNNQEKIYKKMILEDLNEDLKLLQFNLNNIIADQTAIFSFLEKTNKTAQISENDLKSIVPKIVGYYHFIPFNSTFKELESTGNISLISNILARRSLFQYYRLAELLNRMEDAYGMETENYFKPSILKHFPIRRLNQYDFEYNLNSKFPIEIIKIQNDVDFENTLLIKNDLLNNLRETYKSLIEFNKVTSKNL